MKHDHARGRAIAWFTAGTIALLPSAACGGDEGGDKAESDGDADVEDLTDDDYFSNEEYIGETVTVTAEVVDVLSPNSFELAGDEYADESLLVLSKEGVELDEGDIVEVTGTVDESFHFENYADEYGLDEPEPYESYGDEEFLTADRIDIDIGEETQDADGGS